MLRKGKKILIALFALVLAVALFAACGRPYTSPKLDGDLSGEVVSNGGFVVEKGDYVYFINGKEDYTAENKYGSAVKGSLMRISKEDLGAGNFGEVQTVVPLLVVSQDFTSGFYIYGDRVYYATPTTDKNVQGNVENSYLDFKSSKLDGSETMRDYYFRVSDNATVFRYVQDPETETVYCLYIDSKNTEIHSYNTSTREDVTLVKGYASYLLNSDDVTDPTVYYTMSVYKNYNYNESSPQTESYQQVYRVSAFATECPYEMDLSANYTDKETGNVLEYTNFGTLILDGIGKDNSVTPFNHDMKEGVASYYQYNGVTYTLVKYTNGGLYYTNSEKGPSSAILYYLPSEALNAKLADGSWNAVTGNANNSSSAPGDSNVRIAYGTDKAGANAIFYTYNGAQYYIYVEGTSLVRVKVDAAATSFVGEKVYIENGLTASSSDSSDSSDSSSSSASATFLFIDNGYLYYAQSGSSGNNVYRINCVGDKASYNNIGKTEEYKSVKVLDIEYNSSWYKPELVKSGEKSFLFFANVASYSDDYIYAVACPATNAELKEINDKYEDVQDIFTDISEKYSDASNAAKYYFYTADKDILTSEDYTEEYTDDEKAVFDAFVNCTAYAPLFDASVLKDDSQVWNVRSYFMNVVGKVADSDAESIADSLKSDLLAAIS